MMYFFFQRLLLCCLAPPPPLQQIVAAGFCFSSFNILFLFLFVFLYVVLHITFLLNKIIPSVGYKLPKNQTYNIHSYSTIILFIYTSFYALYLISLSHFQSFLWIDFLQLYLLLLYSHVFFHKTLVFCHIVYINHYSVSSFSVEILIFFLFNF